jgi:hypothetical protein
VTNLAVRTIARLAPVALLAVLAAPADAAAPTRTQITSPAGNPAVFLTTTTSVPHITVSGTSNGGASPVDLRCDSSSSMLVHGNIVPSATGAFSHTLTTSELALLAGRTCTLRALPHGRVPAVRTAFSGPVMAVSSLSLSLATQGPSAGALLSFSLLNAQMEGRAAYSSLGGCSLGRDSVFAASLFASPELTRCAARVPSNIGGRSGLQVDGVNTYATAGVYSYAAAGIVPVTYSLSIDPTSGAATLNDVETPLRCAANSTVFPPTAASCPSFVPSPVRVSRTWTQGANGRTSTVTDVWSSADGKAHVMDVVYFSAFAGNPPAFAFPWLGGAWQTLGTGFNVPLPANSPMTVLARPSITQRDNDPSAPAGSLTFGIPPTRIYAADPTIIGIEYRRIVPAQGSVRITLSYSRSTSQAQVGAFAAAAEAALQPPPCTVPRVLRMTYSDARDALHAANCTVGKVIHQTSRRTPKGRVKSQGPKAGSVLPYRSRVTLTVSLGRHR